MLRKLRLLAVSLSILAIYPQAQATVVTLGNLSVTPTNLGVTTQSAPSATTSSGGYTFTSDHSTTTKVVTELALAPTTTSPGLEKDYLFNIVRYNTNVVTYKYDELGVSIWAPDSTPAGSKYLTLSGSVTSAIATTLHFDLTAVGNYVASTSPFGSSVPALASLYLGSALDALAPAAFSTATTNAGASTYSVTNGWSYSVNIAAGQTLSFAAGVFAPNDASLNAVHLNLETAYYNYTTLTTPYENETKTLIDARAVPALAVPESTTYAMLLAGLGMIGMLRRHQARQA